MAVYIALLRAVNVGGTGKLAMSDLRAACEAAGFEGVETYIQSGNVVFRTELDATKAGATLSAIVADLLGKATYIVLCTADEIRDVIERNPFPDAAPNRIAVHFLKEAPGGDLLDAAKGRADEEIEPGKREVYVHYPSGMGKSRLRFPAMDRGTARNLNTVRKLVEMADGLS